MNSLDICWRHLTFGIVWIQVRLQGNPSHHEVYNVFLRLVACKGCSAGKQRRLFVSTARLHCIIAYVTSNHVYICLYIRLYTLISLLKNLHESTIIYILDCVGRLLTWTLNKLGPRWSMSQVSGTHRGKNPLGYLPMSSWVKGSRLS